MVRAATVGTHPAFIRMIRELILERMESRNHPAESWEQAVRVMTCVRWIAACQGSNAWPALSARPSDPTRRRLNRSSTPSGALKRFSTSHPVEPRDRKRQEVDFEVALRCILNFPLLASELLRRRHRFLGIPLIKHS